MPTPSSAICTPAVMGTGSAKDYAAALRWYDEAARHGDPRGFYKLGYAYEQGKGVKADPVRALMWYSLASEEGYEQAAARIERLASQLGPEQRAQAETQAAEWRRDNGTP